MLSAKTRAAFALVNSYFFERMLEDTGDAGMSDAFRLVTQHVMLTERACEIADSLFASPATGVCPGCGQSGEDLSANHAVNPPRCPVMIYNASRSLAAHL